MLSRENMDVRNWMEICVTDLMDTVLENLQVCKCSVCQTDIMALTLNALPPKYVATLKGELYTKIDNLHHQHDVNIIAAISKSAAIVSRNPRHGK